MISTTFHTYPETIADRGRLARTVWEGANLAEAIRATLAACPDAIVLGAKDDHGGLIKGHGPGGLSA